MKSAEILKKYLSFFKKLNHRQIPNHSLMPENDSTLLFVNSGMFPLVPYLSGEPHPLGKRLVNVQRSMRLEDLEEIGDKYHTTIFHMLGNWSLGDYFKKEQLEWIYLFFVQELKLEPQKIFATVFAGDKYTPKDRESIAILQKIFQKYGIEAKEGERIFTLGKEDNWWQRGEAIGELGGPDSEIFYYLGAGSGVGKNPAENKNDFVEIGNSVFMQYRLTANGWENLPQKNVDFGGGLERIAMAIQKKQDIFLTDNFYPIIARLEKLSGLKYGQDPHTTKAMRILADHLRAAALLAMDGVIPGNKDQGYVLRRFLRRMVRFGKNKLKLENISESLFPGVIESLGWLYPELSAKQKEIITLFKTEEERFINTLKRAQKQVDEVLNKIKPTTPALAEAAFNLYQSLGYPPEMLVDDLKDRGMKLTFSKFTQAYQKYAAKHQAISRRGADQKFKGGLADHSQKVIKYHTATHVVHQALRIVLKEAIQQQGSNITANRLRFDFSYHQGLSKNQIKQVEKVVNDTIKAKLPVNFQIMDKNEAIKAGALHFSKEKYPDKVKVYYIGPNLEQAFSKEFCAGPHVQNLAELKPLKIYKQKSVGKGVRRIYAKFV